MSVNENGSCIREWAADHKLPAAQLERWLALAEADRDAIFAIVEGLRLRAGQLMSLLELLGEIHVRDRCPIAVILERVELRRIIEGHGSSPGKARALLDALRGMRMPHLRAAVTQLAARVAELRLPPGIRVILPPKLGSDELKIELITHNGAELGQVLAALAARSEALCAIAESLGGADEV